MIFCFVPPEDHRQDARPDRGHDRRMSGQHAEIALDPGDIDLIDLAGEGELFGRDEIEVKGGHILSVFSLSPAGLTRGSIRSKHFSFDGSPDQVRR